MLCYMYICCFVCFKLLSHLLKFQRVTFEEEYENHTFLGSKLVYKCLGLNEEHGFGNRVISKPLEHAESRNILLGVSI